MREAHPADGLVIVTHCGNCGKQIVWSQYAHGWLHQSTYIKDCPEEELFTFVEREPASED